jgi:hypothetical protein
MPVNIINAPSPVKPAFVVSPGITGGSSYQFGTPDHHANRCYICNDVGVLMLCDGPGCSRVAHTHCAGLNQIPLGDWFCQECSNTPSWLRGLLNSGPSSRSRRVLFTNHPLNFGPFDDFNGGDGGFGGGGNVFM